METWKNESTSSSICSASATYSYNAGQYRLCVMVTQFTGVFFSLLDKISVNNNIVAFTFSTKYVKILCKYKYYKLLLLLSSL